MAIKRVAVIFDNRTRPETTGTYCRRALGNLVEVDHFLPDDLGEIKPGQFDLLLAIDDGLDYPLPTELGPTAYWAIDTHIDFERARRRSEQADLVFAAQRNGAEQLKSSGIDKVEWLPLACDPIIHHPQSVPLQFPTCFVGNLLPGARQQTIERIQQQYPDMFIGRRYFEQMAEIYSASRTALNRSVADDLNMRVFEVLSCGTMLLTNSLPESGQSDLFRDGVHLATYSDDDELLDKLEFYLQNDDLRARIAQAGSHEARERHTYLHRMTTLLTRAEQRLAGITQHVPSPQSVPGSGDKVSACLVSWKRPDNIRQIVQQLRCESLIDDIVIWNNNPDVTLEFNDPSITVIDSPWNRVTYGRYLATQHARHDVIYTQDDDCLVHNLSQLYESYCRDESCITHALKLGHLAANVENQFGDAQMALVGWGALFRKEWCDVLDEYSGVYGEDELLDRKADRLFTLLLNRRHRSLPARVSDLAGASGEEALSVRDDHFLLTRQAVERALALIDSPTARKPVQEVEQLTTQPVETASEPGAIDTPALKDRTYFDFARPELLERIPLTANRVLDVGCGAGRLGAAIKDRQAAEVWGIEREAHVADVARSRLDHVIQCNAEQLNGELDGQAFDAIVCGDVLEHLRDPLVFLRRAADWLAPNGRLIASIPNVRHWTVISSLLEGNWTYEAAGLLDEDHVRFFTRREIEKLLFRAGFEIDRIGSLPGPGDSRQSHDSATGQVDCGRLQIGGLTPAQAAEFFTYQYLIEARPIRQSDHGLTSIIIATHNELAYTRKCVESIRLLTDEPYEMIFVDNASSDGTPDYLDSLDRAHVIRNRDNRGFPAAVNQGLAAAHGENILLLNNDTIVTTGWLRRLLDTLHSASDIGLVGPLSNNVSGRQQIEVAYDELAQLDGFAWDLGRQQAGETTDVERLVGFCLLFRRELVDQIGVLDEQFGIGCFEDDDYCRRALQAGYRAVIVRDAFVHHFGSRTFRANGVDLGQVLSENQQKFDAKWQAAEAAMPDGPQAPSSKRPHFVLDDSDESGLRLKPNDIQLSLCMIVRDNEATIRPCLESIKPWVDEMVVVNTGSTDRTPDICRELGARLFDFPWCDDFSAARNESLRHARGKWLFWMDSDDTIPAECGRQLRELAAGPHDDSTLGYVMQVHCPAADGRDVTAVDHVKLFPNRPDLRFEHRIHEQILPAIRRAGGEVEFTDAYVVHSGSDHSDDGRRRKLERDFRILAKDLDERPEHPFVLFNLGMTCADAGRYNEAIDFLQRSIDASHPGESHLRKAYALLVSTLTQSMRQEQADTTCQRALELFPDDPELLFRRGMLHHHHGRHAEAVAAYLQVLADNGGRHFQSIDTGITGYKARHNLAVVYEEMGRHAQAEAEWRQVVDEEPAYRPGWRGLGDSLLQQDKLTEAEELSVELKSRDALCGAGAVLAARIAERADNIATATSELQAVLAQSTDDLEPLRELCRLTFERRGPSAAAQWLRQLADRDPGDASALHNLGTACLAEGRAEEAADWFQRSLDVRPNSLSTRTQLEAAHATRVVAENHQSA